MIRRGHLVLALAAVAALWLLARGSRPPLTDPGPYSVPAVLQGD